MSRTVILAIALLIHPATTFAADLSGCGRVSNLSAAHLRWAAVRKSKADSARSEESCRAYGTNFFEAVTARQAASLCTDGIERQRALELLDSEIDAFNDIMATQCGG